MIRYILKQQTREAGLWISQVFEAERPQQVKQAVVAWSSLRRAALGCER